MTNQFKLGDLVRVWWDYEVMEVVSVKPLSITLEYVKTKDLVVYEVGTQTYKDLRKVEVTEELLEQYPELRSHKLSKEEESVKTELEKDLNFEIDDVFEELVNTKRYGMADGRQLYDHIVDMFGEYEASVFYKINAIKYIVRYKHKNGSEDLKKAKVYVDLLIGLLEDK